jgi:hypothetical protein
MSNKTKMQTEVEQITALVANAFPCFGGGLPNKNGNPIAEALKEKPAQFAMGVKVKSVVEFVLSASRLISNLPDARMPQRR